MPERAYQKNKTMKIANIKNDFMTWMGVLFMIADFGYFVGQVFMPYEAEILMLFAGSLIGLGLILGPADLYGMLKKKS